MNISVIIAILGVSDLQFSDIQGYSIRSLELHLCTLYTSDWQDDHIQSMHTRVEVLRTWTEERNFSCYEGDA